MHFFNPRPVAEKLRDGILSERQKFSYLIATTVLQGVSSIGVDLSARQPLTTILLLAVFRLFVSCIGLRACFATNERGDNKHFIERWLCLSLPILMWTAIIVFVAVFGISIAAFSQGTGNQSHGLVTLASLSIEMIALVLYFVVLNHFIAIASSGSASDENTGMAPIAAP